MVAAESVQGTVLETRVLPRVGAGRVLKGDELVVLLEDVPAAPSSGDDQVWRILVVDDEEEVHSATRFALSGIRIAGRSLALLHAKKVDEALQLLEIHRDIAVILLDVVMEDSDSGLRLVDRIRNELGKRELRIILRTGQPGSAPELEVITNYDINDYRNKNELTATRLLTTLTSAIRSYQQMRALNAARLGLGTIIRATSSLLETGSLESFATALLRHLQTLLGVQGNGLVAVQSPGAPYGLRVLGSSGHLCDFANGVPDEALAAELNDVLAASRACRVQGRRVTLCVAVTGQPIAVLLDLQADVTHVDDELIQVFSTHVRLCADNVALIAQLRDAAYVDHLTGLPNRTALLDELARSFRDSGEQRELALVNIDNFNAMAETLGQAGSDDLLGAIARRLTDRYRSEPVFIARTNGDEFALVGPQEVLSPLRLQSLFAIPLLVNDMPVPVTATTGIAPIGGPCATPGAVLSGASSALKRGKDLQQNSVQIYTSAMSAELSERVQMLQDLRTAFVREEFHLVLQPQVSIVDQRVFGVEALIRWRRPDGTLVSPDRFIPVAERSGLIVEMGEWVFLNACQQLSQLRRHRAPDLVLAVNVSVVQLRDEKFCSFVERTLREFSIPPHSIELEITETFAMEGMDALLSMIDRLKDIGVRVALDDFGTGYSSLAYLQRLRIDRLKLDRSFVREIGRSRRGERIAQFVADLGNTLGADVLAEGVETAAQAKFLKSIGCKAAQGYYYAQPMQLQGLVEWLGQRKAR